MTPPIPAGLCPVHHQHATAWATNDYQPHNPTEWPGGAFLMDNRTTHDERAREWDRKNSAQVELIARICHSGTSPQCHRKLAAGLAHLATHTEPQ